MSRSSLVKVRDPGGSADRPGASPSSDPLVGGLELLEDTDQGITPGRHTNDGSDPSRRLGQRGRESLRGLPDLQFLRVDLKQCFDPHYVSGRRRGGGGDEETRTPDPLLAKEMLFQLSYVPLPAGIVPDVVLCGGRFWTRTRDLCLIRAVL